MAIGFLYNNKDYKYPKGKLFDDQDEFNEALEAGWNTGPADAAKRAKAEVKEEEKPEDKPPIWPSDDEKEEVKEKPKPKPRTRKRKK